MNVTFKPLAKQDHTVLIYTVSARSIPLYLNLVSEVTSSLKAEEGNDGDGVVCSNKGNGGKTLSRVAEEKVTCSSNDYKKTIDGKENYRLTVENAEWKRNVRAVALDKVVFVK